MADFTIFYSWQSDAPKNLTRGFIEDALRRVVKEIKSEETVSDNPTIDFGMERVPGSPEIATIMFRKIGRSAIFVGDATLVGKISGNPTKKIPNANVSVEMGYAAAYLGWERIICVMNEYDEFGTAEEQPIDTRNRRFPIRYTLTPFTKENDKKRISDRLVNDLKGAIEIICTYDLESAKDAIKLLDEACFTVIATAGKSEYFERYKVEHAIYGETGTSQFDADIRRLLDIGLIWTDFAPLARKYAYHWTFKGKKVCELLGHRSQ